MRPRPHVRSGILSERDLAAVVAEPALCGNTAPRCEAADPLVTDRTLPGLVHNWVTFLQDGIDEMEAKRLTRQRPFDLALIFLPSARGTR